jgi:hypothetical protein
MSRKTARFNRDEVRRALQAARDAGECMAVEILPDGTIRLRPAEKLSEKSTLVDDEEIVRLC